MGAVARKAKFLIVEDDRLVGRALLSTVRIQQAEATWVRCIGEARAALDQEEVEFTGVILDVGLPDGHGLDFLRELRESRPKLPVLVVTGDEDVAISNACHILRASCVFKPEIAANVKLFAARSYAHQRRLDERTELAVQELASRHRLTERETELVHLVALGVPRSQMAEQLGITRNTLKTVVRKVLLKCNHSRIEHLGRAILDRVAQTAHLSEAV